MNQKSYGISILLIGLLFFLFGFVTWLNSILIPFLKLSCQLSYFQATTVAFAFYISYFVMAIPSAWVLRKTGFKGGISLGLWVMTIGALLFIPAAHSRLFGLFLAGLFVQGTGLAIMQTASNPYVTILGPLESAARRISIMGICNKVAGALSPLILGAIVLKGSSDLVGQVQALGGQVPPQMLDELAQRVVMPYIIMALVLALLAIFVRYSPLPEIDTEKEEPDHSGHAAAYSNIFQFPNLVLGVVALFFYVGVEVMAGDTIVAYALEMGLPPVLFDFSGDLNWAEPRFFATYTMLSMVLGYLIGIVTIPKYIRQEQALAGSAILGVIFSLAAILSQGLTSLIFVALLGLANAIVWPAIWPLAIQGLGRFTKLGSSLLIMAIAGGATLPLLYGKLADLFDYRQAYWLLVPGYLVILFYASRGHKIRSWK